MRKKELTLLNVLFCLLVIFIHLVSYPLAGYSQGSLPYNIMLIFWRLSSFVVQGFVLLSGLKMFLGGKEKPYLKMLYGKLKVIILPYAFWYIIYYAFYMIIADYPFDMLFISKHFFLGSLAPHTYFVPLIMQFFILYPLWKLMVKKIRPSVAISVALFISLIAENVLPVILYKRNISFPYNDRLFTTYILYWVIGCYMGAYYEKASEFFKKHLPVALFIAAASANIIFAYINYNKTPLIYYNVIHMIYSICAILFFFGLFMRCKEKKAFNIKPISAIDKSSYTIYLSHMLFVFISNYLFASVLTIQSNILLFTLMALTVYPLSILTSLIIKKVRLSK